MIEAVIKALQQLGELDNTYMQVDEGMATAACGDSSLHTVLRRPGRQQSYSMPLRRELGLTAACCLACLQLLHSRQWLQAG